MAARVPRSGLAFVALLIVTIVTSAQEQPPSAAAGLIVGQVIDAATGRPVKGALVTISGPVSPRRSSAGRTPGYPRLLTGADGYFVFRDLPAGSFSLSAMKSGYMAGQLGQRRPGGTSQSLRLRHGHRLGDVIIRMWKYAAVSGAVVDEAGEPLIAVKVQAFMRALFGGVRRFMPGAAGATDDRGIYRIGNLPPGEYAVAVSSRTVAVPIGYVDRHWVTSSDVWPPPRPGTTESILVGDSVYPVGRGAPVPALQPNGRLLVYPTTFYPSAPTTSLAATVTLGSGEERASIDLQLQPVPTVRVSGTVVRPDGDTRPMTLRLVPTGEEALEESMLVAVADGNGSFVFPAVPAGEYSLGLPRDAIMWTDVALAVGGADIDGIVVTPQRGLHVSGRVEFDGVREKPTAGQLRNMTILVEPAEPTPRSTQPTPVEIGGTGQFTTGGLPGGPYFIRVGASPEGWMFKAASYEGRDLSETPIDLINGDISGVVLSFTDSWTGLSGVVRSSEGRRDPDSVVLVFPTNAKKWTGYGPSPRRFRSVRMDSSGEYGIASLPAGDYYVIAVPDEQSVDWRDPTFLETLARVATLVTIGDGEHRLQDLQTQEVR